MWAMAIAPYGRSRRWCGGLSCGRWRRLPGALTSAAVSRYISNDIDVDDGACPPPRSAAACRAPSVEEAIGLRYTPPATGGPPRAARIRG